MKITVAGIEHVVKTRQAIEILDLVEKSGILEKVKKIQLEQNSTDMLDLLSLIPFSYHLAYDVMAIATGTYENGVMKRNEDLVNEMEAVDLPIHAVSIVKTLILPISYVVSDDTLGNEKKTSSPQHPSTEERSGKSDEKPEVTDSSSTSTTSSVTPDSKVE